MDQFVTNSGATKSPPVAPPSNARGRDATSEDKTHEEAPRVPHRLMLLTR